MSRTAVVALALGLFFVSFAGQCHGALQEGFYSGKCLFLDVETIVASVVKAKFFKDRTIAPALIRMQFHDCFVNGCDASVLLDGSSSEKTAPPNLSLRGFDVIDAAKGLLEKFCPGLVSCADIITMATRDVIFLSGGGRYNVQTGRRDGLVSLAENVDLPSPSISVRDSIAAFDKKGLSVADMVYLLGGHTVGIAHCSTFQDRLYNFQNTGEPDPHMDEGLAKKLRKSCPQNSTGNNIVNLDQGTPTIVDDSFYKQIVAHKGILQIDQSIALDPVTSPTVTGIANGSGFLTNFHQAMVKLGAIEVLTGNEGEIRKSCRTINKRRTPTHGF